MFHFIIVFCAGVLVAMQAAINAALARALGQQALLATFISFAVGTILLFALNLWRTDLQIWAKIAHVSWWKFLGGALGVVFVFTVMWAAPKVGITTTILAIVFGQLIGAAVIDNFALLEVSRRALQLHHLIGLAVIASGLFIYFQGHRYL